MERIQMEVCANSVTSAIEAEIGGAVRVELCDNLPEGGTTPSYAQIKLAKERLKIKVYPIIRPRGGDFLYTDLEFDLMKADIEVCKQLNCDGVVFGILNEDGSVDTLRCGELMELAKPMKVTFHRAFDSSNDLNKSLEDVIQLGCERILTSGGASSAYEGIEKIAELIALAGERISIMPGAGVNAKNISAIIKRSGAREFHASAKKEVGSSMKLENKVAMGNFDSAFNYELTDHNTVRELINEANVRY
jgi:copper homeostasis protein